MSKNNKKSSRSTLPSVHEEDLFVVVHTETGRALSYDEYDAKFSWPARFHPVKGVTLFTVEELQSHLLPDTSVTPLLNKGLLKVQAAKVRVDICMHPSSVLLDLERRAALQKLSARDREVLALKEIL